MNCTEVRGLIDAYIDGELDLVNSLAIERHLPECPDCALMLRNRQTLREGLKDSALYFAPPPDLEMKLRKAIRQADSSSVISFPLRRWGAAAALMAAILVMALFIRGWITPSANDSDPLAQEVIASHIRSLMANHLADVVSTDEHTVKPWFNGKVDFSPVVVDPAKQGFPLIGGRLDYLDNRPVAALVYQRQQHYINVFVWPAANVPDSSTQTLTRQGYHLYYWTQSAMRYWTISDLNPGDLEQFVQMIRHPVTGE